MIHPFVILIKSYKKDYLRTQKLLASIEAYNVDNIPVYLSINDDDYRFFKSNISQKYNVLKDSDIVQCNPKDGWRRQAIVKPQFYRVGVCMNYLCVDADAVFIRPFYLTDFMYNEYTPYTIMHENKGFLDLLEILKHDSESIFHINALKAIRSKFGTKGKYWDYGPNPHLWSCKVWQHLCEEYLAPRNLSFEAFYNELELTALPHEAAIYGEYLLKTRLIDIIPVEGFFKVYHYKEQFELEKPFFDPERLRKNYMGIIIQSNWFAEDDFEVASSKHWWQKLFGN